MRDKFVKALLSILFLSTVIPALAQTVPHAEEGKWPLTIGVAYSNFHTDWSGRLGGPSFWADWTLNGLPAKLHGLGIEMAARDLNSNRTGGDPKLRMDTIGGGPIYIWHRPAPVRPYVKFLINFGRIDFSPVPGYSPNYTHDTRTVYAPAGGADFRIKNCLVLRADLEYQFWPDLIHHHTQEPYGFSIGVSYDFLRPRRF